MLAQGSAPPVNGSGCKRGQILIFRSPQSWPHAVPPVTTWEWAVWNRVVEKRKRSILFLRSSLGWGIPQLYRWDGVLWLTLQVGVAATNAKTAITNARMTIIWTNWLAAPSSGTWSSADRQTIRVTCSAWMPISLSQLKTNTAAKVMASQRVHGIKRCEQRVKTGQWPTIRYQNGRIAPRCRMQLAAIASAHTGLTLMPEGTVDLSMEDYAALALRLIGRNT